MLKKSFIAAFIALAATAGAAQAVEVGGKVGSSFSYAEGNGASSPGLGLNGAVSLSYDNGIVVQTDLGAALSEVDGISSGTVTSAFRAGYQMGNGLTFGAYAGQSYLEVAGDGDTLAMWGLEGKYALGAYEVQAGIGKGRLDLGSSDKLNLETAYLGGRYGLDTAGGELGLGATINWAKDTEAGFGFETKSYLVKADYMVADNLEVYAGLGKVATTLNGRKAESDVVKIGAEYKFGKGPIWRNGPF